jgi:multidrug efflux pump
MSLSSVSIRRPVFTTVLSITVVVFGLAGLSRLGVRELPENERPIISVQATYPGANATVVQNQITEVLEEQINTVSGIRTITSSSREGQSSISIEFELGEDIDRAANDIRDRVSASMGRLPPDADPPTVRKADADGDPIVFLNVSSSQRDLLELTSIADNVFKPRFETISGVGRVDIWGAKQYAMRLWLDPERMAAHGVNAIDVRRAFGEANIELPSGRLEGRDVDVNLRAMTRLADDPMVFENRVIRRVGERVVRLRDVGYAELGPLNERTVLKRNGVPMVGVVIRPQSNANEIAIVDEFYRRLELLRPELPEDIELGIGFDTSQFIRASIAEVRQTLIWAAVLVCFTIFLFLREVRSTIIPLLTIPISLLGTFFILNLAGFSINTLTLLGLVLAIGLVVDDAIVVLENIYRRIEDGEEAKHAAVKGIQQIFVAVVATTLALAAVFAPILFLGGVTGALFKEFGVTLAGSVIISSFIALTLTPMLCSRILKRHDRMPFLYRISEPFFRFLNQTYDRSLRLFMSSPIPCIAALLSCLVVIPVFWMVLPKELAPVEDRNLLVLNAVGPPGVGYRFMLDAMDNIDGIIEDVAPEREATLSVTSPGFGGSSTVNSGFSRVALKPASERSRSQVDVANALTRAFAEYPTAFVRVQSPPTIRAGGRGAPMQLVVQNTDGDKLRDVIPALLNRARMQPVLTSVNVDLEFTQPEVTITIDRDRAEAIGVSARAIADTIQASFSAQRYGYFIKDGEQYQVIGQFQREDRQSPFDLSMLEVRSDSGDLIPISNLISLEEVSAAPVLFRYNRFPSATFSATIAEGYTILDAIAAMRVAAAEVLDETFTTELSGQAREFTEAGATLIYVFIFSLLLVYLVLAAQFESFRSPLIIMLTVPLALAGGILALYLMDQRVNIFSQIGLIMLIGLVTKNGILVVEFANQLRDGGMALVDAAREAAAQRFRPILMTTTSTILGTLPVALAVGAGAESRTSLGIAVIGGLALGSFLTLFVIPYAYTLIANPKPREIILD